MTGEKNLFVSLDESFERNISFGDERKVQVKEIGNILILAKIWISLVYFSCILCACTISKYLELGPTFGERIWHQAKGWWNDN